MLSVMELIFLRSWSNLHLPDFFFMKAGKWSVPREFLGVFQGLRDGSVCPETTVPVPGFLHHAAWVESHFRAKVGCFTPSNTVAPVKKPSPHGLLMQTKHPSPTGSVVQQYGWIVAVWPSGFLINTEFLLKQLCVVPPMPAWADPRGVVGHDGSHVLVEIMVMSAPVSIIPLTFICEGIATVQSILGLWSSTPESSTPGAVLSIWSLGLLTP